MDKPYYVYQCTATFDYSVQVEARDEAEAYNIALRLFKNDLDRKNAPPVFNITLCPPLTAMRFGRPYEPPTEPKGGRE